MSEHPGGPSPGDEPRGPIRVFLLDDHEVVRRGIRGLLEADGDIVVVGESGSAREAARILPDLRPDVAILDGRLPDGSGIEVCREVRAADPSIKAVILTSFDDESAMLAAIVAGASSYLLKEVGGNDLVEGVRRVAAGGSMLDPDMADQLMERLRSSPRRESLLQVLTPQEMRTLELVGEGLTNREVADRMLLSDKTVKNYVSSLLSKLGLSSRTQAAVFVVRQS